MEKRTGSAQGCSDPRETAVQWFLQAVVPDQGRLEHTCQLLGRHDMSCLPPQLACHTPAGPKTAQHTTL